MTEIPFKDLPLYSYDYDAHYPPVATELKNAIAGVDAVLFVTPEYNRSIPGAIDQPDRGCRPTASRYPTATLRNTFVPPWAGGRSVNR
jgi:chromate reductase